MTFGFEREFFVLDPFQKVLVAANLHLPFDGCGYLAEARGEPHQNVEKAAWLLLAEEARIRSLLKDGQTLSTEARKLDKTFKHTCMRRFGKQVQTDFSLSGRWNSPSLAHAGLHIHFGREITFKDKDGTLHHLGAGMINAPRIIWLLDKEFKKDIKDAHRATGLYRLRDHGFEYRSLPASIDVLRVAAFINKEIWNS